MDINSLFFFPTSPNNYSSYEGEIVVNHRFNNFTGSAQEIAAEISRMQDELAKKRTSLIKDKEGLRYYGDLLPKCVMFNWGGPSPFSTPPVRFGWKCGNETSETPQSWIDDAKAKVARLPGAIATLEAEIIALEKDIKSLQEQFAIVAPNDPTVIKAKITKYAAVAGIIAGVALLGIWLVPKAIVKVKKAQATKFAVATT